MPGRRDLFWLLVGALFAFLVAVTVIWVSIDRRPPAWDHANHLERAVMCREILGDPGRDRVREIMAISSFYPPVVSCAAGALYLIFPATPLASQAVILGFLGVGLAACFLLGRALFDSRTGFVAALIFGTAPFVVFSTTNFQLDLPLAAVVVLAIFSLVKSEKFSRGWWSWASGAILALGLVTKPPFVIYVAPALILTALSAFRSRDRARGLGNLAVAIALPMLLTLPWYGPRLFGLPMQLLNRSFKQAAESGYPEALSSASLAFYPLAFLPQFGLMAGLLFAWGVWAIRDDLRARGVLLASCLIPFGVFAFLQNKNLRYTLPILPMAALIAAGGVRRLAPRWRGVVTVGCVVVSVVQVGAAAFGLPPVPAWTPFSLSPFNFPLVLHSPPDRTEWPHERILSLIVKESGGRPVTVSVVPNRSSFSVSNFRYYAARERLPLTVTRAWDQHPLEIDFAILKTGDQGPAFSAAKPAQIMAKLEAGDPPFEKVFPVVARFPLPDGSVATVRKRHLTALEGVAPDVLARRLEAGAKQLLAQFAREVDGLEIRFSSTPGELLRGGIERVHVAARKATVGEFSRRRPPLTVRDVRATLEGLRVNPYRLLGTGEIEPLELGRLLIHHLTVTEDDLRAFLTQQRGLRGLRIRLADGSAEAELRQPGPDVAARLRLLVPGPGGIAMRFEAEDVRLGGLPLPNGLSHWLMRHYDPMPRLSRLPVAVVVERVQIRPGRIEIGSLDGSAIRRLE